MDSVKPGARLLEKGREIAIITVIMALMSAVVYFFLVPSNAAVNSVSGAAIIINGLTGLPISLIARFVTLLFSTPFPAFCAIAVPSERFISRDM